MNASQVGQDLIVVYLFVKFHALTGIVMLLIIVPAHMDGQEIFVLMDYVQMDVFMVFVLVLMFVNVFMVIVVKHAIFQ